MNLKNSIKNFWKFLKQDTWQSWIVSIILLVIIVKFIFFPTLAFVTGTPLPLVIVESCSMYHNSNFNNWWNSNGAWYESHGITKEEFESFPLKNGLNKGDIIFVLGRTEKKMGDIIIFQAGSRYPLIHRMINEVPLGTKGDNNPSQIKSTNNDLGIDETNIPKENVLGEAKVKVIPLLGWVKLIWFEPFKDPTSRGFCK